MANQYETVFIMTPVYLMTDEGTVAKYQKLLRDKGLRSFLKITGGLGSLRFLSRKSPQGSITSSSSGLMMGTSSIPLNWHTNVMSALSAF